MIRPLALSLALLAAPAALAQFPQPPPPPAQTPPPTLDPPQLQQVQVTPAAPTREQELSLTLQEAQRLAILNNLDLEIARTEPLAAAELVGQALGSFDPIGFAEWKTDHRETPIASSVQSFFGSGAVIEEDEWNYGAGFNGILPFGLSYATSYNLRRLDSNSGFQALDREFRPVATTSMTLPLLRDLIYNEANLTLKRSRIARQISDEDFRTFVTDFLVVVESDYWNLVASRGAERVAAKSLQTARDLHKQVQVQYEVGVVSRVRVSEADAGVAEREGDYIVSSNRARAAQDTLLNTIRVPSPQEYRETRILPEDPTYVDYSVNEAASIELALAGRPEIASARGAVEDAEIQLSFAKNQRLPRLDVSASYTMSGLSGTQRIAPGPIPTDSFGNPLQTTDCRPMGSGGTTTVNMPCASTFVPPQGDLGVASSSLAGDDDFFNANGTHGWGLGARVEIPIGNRTARRRVTQREIDLRRARQTLRRAEQLVILDVRNAARNLVDAAEALHASERRINAQRVTLDAEQERLRLGDSTPFQVLEKEEDLVEAEVEQISSLQAYRNSIAGLEKANATLLEQRGISVGEALNP